MTIKEIKKEFVENQNKILGKVKATKKEKKKLLKRNQELFEMYVKEKRPN